MAKIRITDTTLRDGSHTVAHQFSREDVASITQALDLSGVDIIEVGHGDDLTGSTCNYGFSRISDLEMVEIAVNTAKRAQIAVLLIPGIGTMPDLEKVHQRGAQIVRVATHVTEADISAQHIIESKQMGFFVVGFLMMAHRAPVERVVAEALKMESYGADVVYVTDSAGAMLPQDVREKVSALRQQLQAPIGFHSHNNLGLAIGNSLAAIEAGATYIDGSLGGLGAGAGNTATETLIAVLRRKGEEIDGDLYKAIDSSSQVLRPILAQHGLNLPDLQDPLMLGYSGVYSSFMLHARRAANRFGVDYRDIILEAGRREAVGGQEDWLYEIAESISKS